MLCRIMFCIADLLVKDIFLDIFSVGLISETKCLVYLE